MSKSILQQLRDKKESDLIGSYIGFVSAADLSHTVLQNQNPNDMLAMQPNDRCRLACLKHMIDEAERYKVSLSKARKALKRLDKMGSESHG